MTKQKTPKDVTNHLDPDKTIGAHDRPPVPHSPKWYELFGGKCPVCGVEAKHA